MQAEERYPNEFYLSAYMLLKIFESKSAVILCRNEYQLPSYSLMDGSLSVKNNGNERELPQYPGFYEGLKEIAY